MGFGESAIVEVNWHALETSGGRTADDLPAALLALFRITTEDEAFLHQVAAAIADAGAVLITGPANAKTALVKHMHRHDPRLIEKLAGIETVDHPSDASLVAHARHYFKTEDRMKPA